MASEFWTKMNTEFEREKAAFLEEVDLAPVAVDGKDGEEANVVKKPRMTEEEAMERFYAWWLENKKGEYRDFQKTWTREQWGLIRPGWEAWRRAWRWKITKAWYERFG
ncbi:hypothetical protein BT69DRAFT_1283985 [Atractiella rhizophila]|nr:hypothetical protein BT69DRAFT_1283985 [Atractiella rhizophila]